MPALEGMLLPKCFMIATVYVIFMTGTLKKTNDRSRPCRFPTSAGFRLTIP